jgi:hypothetical protein
MYLLTVPGVGAAGGGAECTLCGKLRLPGVLASSASLCSGSRSIGPGATAAAVVQPAVQRPYCRPTQALQRLSVCVLLLQVLQEMLDMLRENEANHHRCGLAIFSAMQPWGVHGRLPSASSAVLACVNSCHVPHPFCSFWSLAHLTRASYLCASSNVSVPGRRKPWLSKR